MLVTGGADSVTVDLGDPGEGVFAGALSGGSLPIFGDTNQNGSLSTTEDNNLSVTLNLEGQNVAAQIDNIVNLADELALAGIDYIGVNADQAGNITISDTQASLLVGAGLAFSEADGADDQITVEVSAEGTQLQTSLQDLQKLGVGNVLVDGQSATVDLGSQSLNLLSGSSLPTFGDTNNNGILSSDEDAALTITLDLGVSALLPASDPIYTYLAAKGIDYLNVTDPLNPNGSNWIDLSVLKHVHDTTVPGDQALGFEITTSGSTLEAEAVSLDANLAGVDLLSPYTTSPDLYGQLIHTLSDAGVLDIVVDHGNVKVTDALAKALIDAGMLQALPNANVSLDYQYQSGDPYAALNTTLKDMASLGVDAVNYTAVDHNKVYVDLGLPVNDLNALNDVVSLLHTLNESTTNSGAPVFSNSGSSTTALVINTSTLNSIGVNGKIDTSIIDGLFKLGITEVDVLGDNGNSSTNDPQSGTIGDITVHYIGTDDPQLQDYLHLKYPTL